MLFSYDSELCSSMLTLKIKNNPLNKYQIYDIVEKLNGRIKVDPQ